MSKVTYTNVIKFKFSNRLFKGSDGRFYLADESADDIRHPRRFGRPDECEGGPFAIVLDEPIRCSWEEGTYFSVTCDDALPGRRCSIGLTGNAALYLAAHLGMTVKAADGEFRINPLPKETS